MVGSLRTVAWSSLIGKGLAAALLAASLFSYDVAASPISMLDRPEDSFANVVSSPSPSTLSDPVRGFPLVSSAIPDDAAARPDRPNAAADISA